MADDPKCSNCHGPMKDEGPVGMGRTTTYLDGTQDNTFVPGITQWVCPKCGLQKETLEEKLNRTVGKTDLTGKSSKSVRRTGEKEHNPKKL